MKYQRIKILDQYLKKGLTSPNQWGKINVKSEMLFETAYDVALEELGFINYIKDILCLNLYEPDIIATINENNITLHQIYLTIINNYLGASALNTYELGILKNTETEEISEILQRSKRYNNDKAYYNQRIPMTKSQLSRNYHLLRMYQPMIKSTNNPKAVITPVPNVNLKNELPNQITARIDKTNLIMTNYDNRAFTVFNQTTVPYAFHIHPYLFGKIMKYLPSITKEEKTIYSAISQGGNAQDFEVIFLTFLETQLTKDVETLKEFLHPVVNLGHVLKNHIAVAYAVPESKGQDEYYKVIFRYENELEIITDRNKLLKILQITGLNIDKEGGSPILKDKGVTLWDYIYLGSYRAKNGNENDLRDSNLMK